MYMSLKYIIVLILALGLTGVIAGFDTRYARVKMSEKARHSGRNILVTVLLLFIVYLAIDNFPITLTMIVIVTGLISLSEWLFFSRHRLTGQPRGFILEQSRGFFPVLFLVWIIRSFLIQPYHVPTGSLEPTVLAGDFIAVNQYAYGLRFPIGNVKFVNIGEPKRGDLVLFYAPPNPAIVYVKRLVGMPGDHIVYKDKVLYVNGQEAKQSFVGTGEDVEPGMEPQFMVRKQEDLLGIQHDIFIKPEGGQTDNFDVTVPDGMYFMMGDNRDNSDDSRYWGFVPERNLIGKAVRLLISWDANAHHFRWDRTGKAIH